MPVKFVMSIKTFVLNNEWICENTPCKLLYIKNDEVCLKPFNKSGNYTIHVKLYNELFTTLENDDEYIYISCFPNRKIHISEFDIEKINKKNVQKHFKNHIDGKNILKFIDKIFLSFIYLILIVLRMYTCV